MLFGYDSTKITSMRFLVKFDSFQRPLPTFSFDAILLNCSFFSNFEVVLGVLYKLEANVSEKIICFAFCS